MDQPLRDFDDSLARDCRAPRLIGVDEAGRGPLAGPVVAAALSLAPGSWPELAGANDSKRLSPAARRRFFTVLRKLASGGTSCSIGVGWAAPEEIDRENILNATLLAMRRAVLRLGPAREGALVLVDGDRTIPGLELEQRALIGGDGRSLRVACASIVAKVVRDRWMEFLDSRHPGYGFLRHKGYGTPEHLEALSRLGPCLIHRRSFAPVERAGGRVAR